MRRRPWVLVVALLILALSFSIVVGIRYLNRSNRLRNELMQAFSGLPGNLSIASATLESSTLQLTGIRYETPDTSVTVDIRRISMRLALTNLVRRSGGIERIVQSVAINEPVVELRADKLSGSSSSSQTLPDFSTYNFLERIILREGVLRVMGQSPRPWAELHGIDGWIVTAPQHRLNFELAASAYQDTLRSLAVDGSLDLKELTLTSRLSLSNYDLSNLVLPKAAPFSSVGGRLDLHAKASLDSNGFDYNANWKLAQGNLHISKGPRLDAINLAGLVEDGLATADGSLTFEDDPTEFHASIDLTGPVEIDAEAFVPKGRLGVHLGTFAGLRDQDQPKGLIQARFNYHSKAGEGWSFTARATTPSLDTPIGEFTSVESDLHWDPVTHSIVFDYLEADWFGLDALAQGQYNFGVDDRFPVSVDVSGVVDPSKLPDWTEPLSNKEVDGVVTLNLHPVTGWIIRTEGRVRNQGDPTLGEFTGVYDHEGYDLRLNLFSSYYQDAAIRMWAKHHQIISVTTEQPQLLAGWWSEEYQLPERVKGLDVETELHFGKGKVTGGGDIRDPSTGFSLRSDGTLFIQEDKPYSAVLSYTFLRHEGLIGNGDAEVRYSDGLLTLDKLSFMDFLHGSGGIDLKNREIGRLEFAVEDLDASELIPALTSLHPAKVDGRINGRLVVSGPFIQPVINSHFEMSEGRYGDLDEYWGLLTVESDIQGNVNIQQGAVGHGGRTLLTLNGGYNIPDHQLDVAVASPGSDARVISQALTGRDDLLVGTISLVGRLGGSLTLPRWTMNVGMQDAQIIGIRFTNVSLALRGESTKRLGHVLYIDEFDLNRPDRYRFQAFGAAPLSRGAGQLSFVLDGDLPQLLPQMTPFIKSGEGKGELNWIVTMVGGKPATSQGNLKLQDGSLTFDSIFPEMKNINIDVDVDVDGHTQINTLEARLGSSGRRIIATNEPGSQDDPDKQPVKVRTLGLDLGVLKVKTPHTDGIPMRIPAISSTPENANVKFGGLNGEEWFQVSGPTDSLLIQGEATISNVVFTLPEKSGSSGNSRTERSGAAEFAIRNLRDVIYSARWNAELNVGRDVRFEYVIGGLEDISLANAFNLLGQVSVDLELESTDPQLPLRAHGRLIDDSFRLGGTISSTQGDIEFLDLSFEMQRAEVTFDQTSLLPVVSARAVSNIVEPGTDFSRRAYLTLYVIDPVTGERTTRGRWGEFTLVLEDEDGSSQEQVASTLGISPTAIRDRATLIGAGGLEKAVTRMWLRPIERDVERWLGLDLVRIDPTIAQNLASDPTTNNGNTPEEETTKRPVDYFRSSSVTVGKYLTRDLFLSYTGQLGKDPRYTTVPDYQAGRIGLLQTWSLQYRLSEISPNFVIQGDWEYDNLADVQGSNDPTNLQNNRSLKLKYTFVFDATKINWP